MNWTAFDFIFMGTLIFGTGLTYVLIARRANSAAYRIALGVAVMTGLLLVWINAAVGIIGEDNGTNLMYFGVLLIGIISALISRFQPLGMARTLCVMALAQALVPVIALFVIPPTNWGAPGVFGIFVLNSIFVAAWIASALLFRQAARKLS